MAHENVFLKLYSRFRLSQAVNLITCDALESPPQEVISHHICIFFQHMNNQSPYRKGFVHCHQVWRD